MPQAIFESSALSQTMYDDATQCLQVEFRDGTICKYSGVPSQVYAGLLQAESKGRFLNAAIRGRFPYDVTRGPNTRFTDA